MKRVLADPRTWFLLFLFGVVPLMSRMDNRVGAAIRAFADFVLPAPRGGE